MAGTIDNITKAAAVALEQVNQGGKPPADLDLDDSTPVETPVSKNVKSDLFYLGVGGAVGLTTNPSDATGGYTSGGVSIGPEKAGAGFIGGGQLVVKFRLDTLGAQFGDHVPKASCAREEKAVERCEAVAKKSKDKNVNVTCVNEKDALDSCETAAERKHTSEEQTATRIAIRDASKGNPVYLQIINRFGAQDAVSDEGKTYRNDLIIAPQLALAGDVLGGAILFLSIGGIYSATVDAIAGPEIEAPLDNLGVYASTSLQWDMGGLALEAGLEGFLYPANFLNSDNQDELSVFGGAGIFFNFLY